MLTVKNIYKSYGDKIVLSGLSFDLRQPGLYLIEGASGIGKTTLLRLIAGLEKLDSGEIITKGKISYAFQENRLFPWMSLEKNLAVVTHNAEKAKQLLEYLNLNADKSLMPREMSGGMLRRAELVRALAVDFDILLADEPFGGLDKDNAQLAANLLKNTAVDKCVLLVSHDNRYLDEPFTTISI